MRVISIANFKGGTGKTATAVNMAAFLADAGYRVLLIDADPQHNATDFYAPIEAGPTLTDVLEGLGEAVWSDNVVPVGRRNLDLLGADMGLLRLDLAAIIAGSTEARRRMADFIGCARADDAYDFVIIDCPPSFTAASVAALSESDDVILPTRADAWSRAGVLEMIAQVRSLGRAARCRVLITMADRTNLARQGAELLREDGLDVFRTEIRRSVAVGESSYARQPLCDYEPGCNAARDYDALVREYLEEVTDMNVGDKPRGDEDAAPYAGEEDDDGETV